MSRYRFNARVRKAMHDAADFIEANPERHNFTAGVVDVNHKGMPECGCALVWVGYFGGFGKGGVEIRQPYIGFGLVSEETGLPRHPEEIYQPGPDEKWDETPAHIVARNLRIFSRARV